MSQATNHFVAFINKDLELLTNNKSLLVLWQFTRTGTGGFKKWPG